MIKPFHLAIPVTDLAKATTFYESVLGCSRGREDEHWIDFNLYGHQLVCHLSNAASEQISNPVDGDNIPVPHFGVILDFQEFDALAERLRKNNQEFNRFSAYYKAISPRRTTSKLRSNSCSCRYC